MISLHFLWFYYSKLLILPASSGGLYFLILTTMLLGIVTKLVRGKRFYFHIFIERFDYQHPNCIYMHQDIALLSGMHIDEIIKQT